MPVEQTHPEKTNPSNSPNPTSKPSQPRPEEKAEEDPLLPIKSHLESLSKSCITSLNTRNFSPTAPGWSSTLPTWTAEFSNHVTDPSQPNAAPPSQDLVTFLAQQRDTAENFPSYHMEVQGISSEVDVKHGRASVFTRVEVGGIPEGVVRQSMVLSEYVRVGSEEGGEDGVVGRWLCGKCIGIRGVPNLS